MINQYNKWKWQKKSAIDSTDVNRSSLSEPLKQIFVQGMAKMKHLIFKFLRGIKSSTIFKSTKSHYFYQDLEEREEVKYLTFISFKG